tara:strand:- start:17583 stop:17771 length:189 start_codon:yes stop_codon:yes gene_type:complete
MRKILRNQLKQNIPSLNFIDIDSKLLNGWTCQQSQKTHLDYLEKIKYQTQLAMNNKKFPIKQ